MAKPKNITYEGLSEIGSMEKQENEVRNRQFDETYRIKKHVTTAPTYEPKNFYEQIVLFDNGASRRLYTYVNNTWRYVTLT